MIAFLAGQVRSEIYQSFSDIAGKAVQAAVDTHHSVWRKNSRRYGCVRNAVFGFTWCLPHGVILGNFSLAESLEIPVGAEMGWEMRDSTDQ